MILHPELYEKIPVSGLIIADKLTTLSEDCLDRASDARPDVSLVIRTLNEAESLDLLFSDIDEQIDAGDYQVIVVDNESSDDTVAVAKSYGAEIVTIPRGEFTYPKSMNIGIEAADNQVVYLTVGHARLTTDALLAATRENFIDEGVAGAFGRTLPNANASMSERLLSIGNIAFVGQPKKIKKAGLGVMGATSAAVKKEAWRELGTFDERYETGGEDTALAQNMLDSGFDVVEDSLLSVHHSHGLNLHNTVRQWQHWIKTLRGPIPMDRNKLQSRRPDIDFS